MELQVSVTEHNWKVGDKVIRGQDWAWGEQDRHSVHGVLTDIKTSKGWVKVKWVNEKGIQINTESYRIGGEGKYDLYFLEPTPQQEPELTFKFFV